MSWTIVASGRTTQKFVDFKGPGKFDVTPHVADHKGEFGVGFYIASGDKKTGWLWGLAMPHLLIQSWRAMKLLEEVPCITRNTLCACWYAARERLHGSDNCYLSDLEALFPSYEDFRAVRARALAMVPTDEELQAMLRIVEENELGISTNEVKSAMKKANSSIFSIDAILERLRIADEARWEEGRREVVARAEREAERAKIPPAATLPQRLTLWQRLFG